MTLLFVLYCAGLISVQRLSCDENIHEKSHIQNFPFSLHRSTSINGTIKRGQLNLHYANFEKSNVLDLLRIHVRLNDVNKSWDINKPLLQVTCQHPVDAISFTLPTESGEMENGVLLSGLDMETVKSSFDNRSVCLVILVTANSDDVLIYHISVKIYDRSQYSVVLRAPEFSRALSNQKVSAVIPIAFRVNIPDVSVRLLKITVRSDDDFCAFMVIQNCSTAFLHSTMLALNSSVRVTFTRKASIILLANSPFDIFIMMMNDDRMCNPFAPAREYNRKKKFDILFSGLESTSLYPLIIISMVYLTLAIIFLASDQLMPRLRDGQGRTDMPLIVLSDESCSETFPSSTHQELAPIDDSFNTLVHIQMDEDEQQLVKDTALLRTTEQRSVNNGINIITRTFEDQLSLMNDHLDVCHYNMECSVRLGPFHTFNHMYSNIGYFSLGFIFIILISRRYKYWKYHRCTGYNFCPHVFFNVGLMMCLESFASAFYHICPNPQIFHIDTLFVEVALILLMVRFYFVRRGGISLSGIFQSIIFAISFHFAGNALKDKFYLLGIILSSGLLLLIIFQYHLLFGSQSSVESIQTRDWTEWLEYCWQLLTGNERDRSLKLKKILLACITACNIALGLLFETGLLRTTYITLYIIMLNTTGYFIYYVFCKIIDGETILTHVFIYAIASFVLWIVAFYFFNYGKIDWTLTAAQNRAITEECIVFNYYDYHDMWHFSSSLASFFSLLTIAILDDGIMISDFDQQSVLIF
uniref:SID1 transmembrane family member 1 n=1 Tax=Onchocerca volvulus TaxID=6282 RepID=A0A8R1XXP1_ONCVO